jgi:UPF0755 protein
MAESSAGVRRLKRVALAAGAVAVLAAAASSSALAWLCRAAPTRPDAPEVDVVIERGWGIVKIAAALERNGVVADRRGFVLLAKWRGKARRLQAGEYRFARGGKPQAALDVLLSGKTVRHYFMVVPGETAPQAAAKMQAAGIDPPGLAARLIDDPAFADSLAAPAPRLEGFLWPETYAYERGEDAKTLLTRMVRLFQRKWADEFAARAALSGLTEIQAVTLASIVEKETGYEPERTMIARVFLNRLARGMPLQSDPTTIYALGAEFRGELTKADLQRDLPYNTYVRSGLPPGPICNPGAGALEAVLSPADGPWLYFVAAGEGRHVFSSSYAEHLQAVNRFLKGSTRP